MVTERPECLYNDGIIKVEFDRVLTCGRAEYRVLRSEIKLGYFFFHKTKSPSYALMYGKENETSLQLITNIFKECQDSWNRYLEEIRSPFPEDFDWGDRRCGLGEYNLRRLDHNTMRIYNLDPHFAIADIKHDGEWFLRYTSKRISPNQSFFVGRIASELNYGYNNC